jgi:hypothetical protein
MEAAIPRAGCARALVLELQQQIDAMAPTSASMCCLISAGRISFWTKLKTDVDRAHAAATQQSTEAYSKAKAEIDRLRRELEQTQVLDLRWAIFGIYMIAIGIALSYWA